MRSLFFHLLKVWSCRHADNCTHDYCAPTIARKQTPRGTFSFDFNFENYWCNGLSLNEMQWCNDVSLKWREIAFEVCEGSAECLIMQRFSSERDAGHRGHELYVYQSDRILKSGVESWRCAQKNCKGWIHCNGDIVTNVQQHNHNPKSCRVRA